MKLSPAQIWRIRESQYRLVITVCESCGKKSAFKRSVCPFCGSGNVKHMESEGLGKVLEVTKVLYRWASSDERPPSLVAVVELDEGVKVVGEIVGVGTDEEVKEGTRVEAVLRRYASDDPYGVIYYGIKFKPLKTA